MGALKGVKVLDLSRLLPGPYCTLMMADYGAEVTKIEEPGQGDYIRWRKPALIKSIFSKKLYLINGTSAVLSSIVALFNLSVIFISNTVLL